MDIRKIAERRQGTADVQRTKNIISLSKAYVRSPCICVRTPFPEPRDGTPLKQEHAQCPASEKLSCTPSRIPAHKFPSSCGVRYPDKGGEGSGKSDAHGTAVRAAPVSARDSDSKAHGTRRSSERRGRAARNPEVPRGGASRSAEVPTPVLSKAVPRICRCRSRDYP